MELYEERKPWGSTYFNIIPDTHTHFVTEKQTVDIITNPFFGRMLFLDRVLQSSTSDERVYHEALVGSVLRGESRRVLIAGGAEGAVAREVLRLPVESCVMIDWDKELVDHIRLKEKWNTEAFADPRLSLVHEDIFTWCSNTDQKFDTVILDLLDIDTKEDEEFTQRLLENLTKVAEPGALLSMNVGRNYALATELAAYGSVLRIDVPSFMEPWYLVKGVLLY